jgi:enoyl-[acyl-carrier protein] reductase I
MGLNGSSAGLLDGKKAFVFGVANECSLATYIGEALHRHGASVAFAHLPGDKAGRRVRAATEMLAPVFYVPCDVTRDTDIADAFDRARTEFGTFDILIHSVAFAPQSALKGAVLATTRDDFHRALDVSTYSLIALTRAGSAFMNPGGSILTLSYVAAQRVIPGYTVMALAKAALECAVRYLAWDLGRQGAIRVNAISAGPVDTLAMRALSNAKMLLPDHRDRAPIGRNITPGEIGNAAVYLCSGLATAVTGSVHYVDGGYHVTV